MLKRARLPEMDRDSRHLLSEAVGPTPVGTRDIVSHVYHFTSSVHKRSSGPNHRTDFHTIPNENSSSSNQG